MEKAEKDTIKVPEQKKTAAETWKQHAKDIIWAVIIALLIRYFVASAYSIPSGSMESTLLVGDYLFANKFVYGTRIPFTDIKIIPLKKPQKKDIIIFKWTGQEYVLDRDTERPLLDEATGKYKTFTSKKDFIKRCVGVPGDTIEVRNKALFVNGVKQEEAYVQYFDAKTIYPKEKYPRDNFGPVTVPEKSYFMMGDNRDESNDSRFWGFVKESDIIGTPLVRLWPLHRIKLFL
ncbi:MAG: signal peptidase I [Candidatus Firestonebacteria bacterium]